VTASDLLVSAKGGEMDKMAGFVRHFSNRLHQEVAMQRYLIGRNTGKFELRLADVDVHWILDEIERMVSCHPSALRKNIQCAELERNVNIKTDVHILQRVLINMLINALEATEIEHSVCLGAKIENGCVVFSVWNSAHIPPEIRERIFQKYFSSKGEMGRGLGTYSMKLFGEKILGGKLHFTSTPQDGTTFYFSLPYDP
jgi:signal transduction histidine kinase